MSYLLVITRKRLWDRTEEATALLAKGDVPADCVTGFKTVNNEMSVWHIEADKSNLVRVLAAFAATRSGLDKVDYLLFDPNILSRLDIRRRKSDGKTPDRFANISWHHDLVELSGQKIVRLATSIFQDAAKDRVLEKKVREWIKTAIADGAVDVGLLNAELLSKLDPGSPQPKAAAVESLGIALASSKEPSAGSSRHHQNLLRFSRFVEPLVSFVKKLFD